MLMILVFVIQALYGKFQKTGYHKILAFLDGHMSFASPFVLEKQMCSPFAIAQVCSLNYQLPHNSLDSSSKTSTTSYNIYRFWGKSDHHLCTHAKQGKLRKECL